MLPVGGPRGSRAVLIGSSAETSAALRMRDHNVPVDEGVRRRTLEAVVLSGLVEL